MIPIRQRFLAMLRGSWGERAISGVGEPPFTGSAHIAQPAQGTECTDLLERNQIQFRCGNLAKPEALFF
jgi:hypothetical protein